MHGLYKSQMAVKIIQGRTKQGFSHMFHNGYPSLTSFLFTLFSMEAFYPTSLFI